MSEFKASDPEVCDIAAVFALRGWEWTVRDGKGCDPYVPQRRDIARTLNNLYKAAKAAPASRNSGHCRSGRLWVEWIDQGYGDEISFGISYERRPA